MEHDITTAIAIGLGAVTAIAIAGRHKYPELEHVLVAVGAIAATTTVISTAKGLLG